MKSKQIIFKGTGKITIDAFLKNKDMRYGQIKFKGGGRIKNVRITGLDNDGGGSKDESTEYTDEECLGFTAVDGDVTVSLQNNNENAPVVYYKREGQNWTLWDYSGINIAEGETIRFYGDNSFKFSRSSSKYSTFIMSGTGKINATGNCDSLLSKQKYGIIQTYCFYKLFNGCINLVTPPQLNSKFIDSYCYSNMFNGCINLINAPKLPAEAVRSYSYERMFAGCTALVNAPELPAKKLDSYCYMYMFNGCDSLIEICELPARVLASRCYDNMFSYCRSLVNANITLGDFLESGCCREMFSHCSSLQEPPQLPATKLADTCYQGMFSYCDSLIKTPVLNAKILASQCYEAMFLYSNISTPVNLPALELASSSYNRMFDSNKNLNYVKALFITTPGSSVTNEWLKQVAATGTFVKNAAAIWDVRGANGVPTGWTIETADN